MAGDERWLPECRGTYRANQVPTAAVGDSGQWAVLGSDGQ